MLCVSILQFLVGVALLIIYETYKVRLAFLLSAGMLPGYSGQ